METIEKLGYLKGLVDGLELDANAKETKAIKAIVDLLDSICEDLDYINEDIGELTDTVDEMDEDLGELDLDGIDWVIVGGESGPQARPMKESWALNIRKQVEEQGIRFFFKQWGTWGADGIKRNKHANGKLLKGEMIQEMPCVK